MRMYLLFIFIGFHPMPTYVALSGLGGCCLSVISTPYGSSEPNVSIVRLNIRITHHPILFSFLKVSPGGSTPFCSVGF